MIYLSFLSVFIILCAYATGRERLFDWANATLFIFVAIPSIQAHIWPPVIINCAFGLIAINRIVARNIWRIK